MNDDDELVQRTLRGDGKAFEMIIHRYERSLVNYVGRMVGEREAALDFSQEVFFKAYSSLGSYRSEYRFSTWLFKIASNLLIDFWRKRKIKAVSLDCPPRGDSLPLAAQIADGEPSVTEKYESAELRRKIERTLQRIPPSLRDLFILRHINEFSYEEIAEIKGLPVGTVKNRVYQAKELLRRMLGETP